MIKSGLVSITFRQLTPGDIIDLVKKAKLDGIEWGGDIHVPHGDIAKAEEVYRLTRDAGLDISAYGSYYMVGKSEQEGLTFNNVLRSAVALKTSVIRVWAGNLGSADADESYRQNIVKESKRIANLAKAEGIKIAYECHAHSLTDTGDSLKQLLRDVDRDNIFCYWQPDTNIDHESNRACLTQSVGNKLANIHVFYWEKENSKLIKKPLEDGKGKWIEYLKIADNIPGVHYAMLEFVENNQPDNFLRDAASLKSMING